MYIHITYQIGSVAKVNVLKAAKFWFMDDRNVSVYDTAMEIPRLPPLVWNDSAVEDAFWR